MGWPLSRALPEGMSVSYEIIGHEPQPGAAMGSDRERLLYLIHELGLTDRVELTGALSREEVRDRLRASDVLLHPSYSEGIANTVLEAMACALPVVVTDVGGMGEVVSDGVHGFLCPPREPCALADALGSLWKDKAATHDDSGALGGRECLRTSAAPLRSSPSSSSTNTSRKRVNAAAPRPHDLGAPRSALNGSRIGYLGPAYQRRRRGSGARRRTLLPVDPTSPHLRRFVRHEQPVNHGREPSSAGRDGSCLPPIASSRQRCIAHPRRGDRSTLGGASRCTPGPSGSADLEWSSTILRDDGRNRAPRPRGRLRTPASSAFNQNSKSSIPAVTRCRLRSIRRSAPHRSPIEDSSARDPPRPQKPAEILCSPPESPTRSSIHSKSPKNASVSGVARAASQEGLEEPGIQDVVQYETGAIQSVRAWRIAVFRLAPAPRFSSWCINLNRGSESESTSVSNAPLVTSVRHDDRAPVVDGLTQHAPQALAQVGARRTAGMTTVTPSRSTAKPVDLASPVMPSIISERPRPAESGDFVSF